MTSGPGTGQPTVTLTYGYDQLGDETSVTDSLSSQGITSLAYDADQRVTGITQSFGGTAGPQVLFGYDPGSRLTTITRQIGSSNYATEVNTAITYDAANREVTTLNSVSVFQGFGWSTTPLATQVYSYDSANRLTSETDKEGTASFTYDNANELTGVTGSRSESYTYDNNGNRTGTGYHTTAMNELSTAPGHTYTYDNAGNLISDNNGSTITTYTYDYENRLINVTTGGTIVATYTYNALDQRIGVKDNGTQTWTVYNGTSPDANPYADFNGSGSLTMRYLFGPGAVNGVVTPVILARTSSSGTTAWYLTDKLGSVRDIVDTSGNELDHIVYDSFGNIVTETNASSGDRFKFAGMQYDATTGQYYDHARWYGAGPGRFTSPDPVGFNAGDTDLYRYVDNGPSIGVDPSGLDYALNPTFEQAMIASMAGGVRLAATQLAAGGAALAEASVAALPAMAEGVAIAGTAVVVGELGAIGYYGYQYVLAQMAGGVLDEQIRQAQMRLVMEAMRKIMILGMAGGVRLGIPKTPAQMKLYMQWSVLLGMGVYPPSIPPTKPTSEWKKLIDRLIRWGGGDPPETPTTGLP